MAKFKPSAMFFPAVSGHYKSKTETFDTYRELRKAIPRMTEESHNGDVYVSRSRRGEWGEWFENWQDGKIEAQGWM